MKKTLLFSVALAGLMLGSCSSSDDLNGGGNNSGFNENGDGYVAVAINLPTQNPGTSRANDNFKDGTAEEYEVKDAKLLLFNGADEASATFVQAYPLTLTSATPGAENKQITTRYQQTVKISSSGLTNNIYALVVLNDNGLSYTVGDKMSKILTVNSSDLKNTGFLMTNAPLSTKVGANPFDGKVNTLVPVTSDNIQKTPESAASHAVEISVERALAKVEMGTAMTPVQTTDYTGTVTEVTGVKTAGKKLYYTVTGWELANTNKQTYFTRSWTNDWASYEAAGATSKFRFIGTNSLNDDSAIPASELYRTYWAIDPNYDLFTTGALGNSQVTSTDRTTIKYCLENTFNVLNQKIQSTTCAIVGVQLFTADNDASPTKYTPMTDFYTVDSDPTVVYDKATIEKLILARYVAQNASDLKTLISGTVSAQDLLTVSETSSDAGVVSYTVTAKADSRWTTTPTTEQLENWKSGVEVKDLEHVKNGINYYYVPIRHFDNDETPWSADGKTKSYPNDDGKAEQNWLGRYGVLRNNWYEISISALKGFGHATIPDLSKIPDDDDNLKEYVSVKINVLSWAKRTQGATLGE